MYDKIPSYANPSKKVEYNMQFGMNKVKLNEMQV
jgi:hypothetical protein